MGKKHITIKEFDARMIRAIKLFQSKKYKQSVVLIEPLLATNPQGKRYDEMCKWYGYSLAADKRYRRGAKYLEIAWEKFPWEATVGLRLSLCLLQLSRLDDGLARIREVRKLTPKSEPAISLEMDLLTRMRRQQEAADLVDEAREKGIAGSVLAMRFSNIAKKLGRGDEAVEWLRDAIKVEKNESLRRSMHFSQGDLLDRMGGYDEAFENYAAGNAMREGTHDKKKTEELFEKVRTKWTPERITALRARASKDERPVFIVGLPRSGTTLTEQVIARHPQVAPLGELYGLLLANGLITERFGGTTHDHAEKLTPSLVAQCAKVYTDLADDRGGKGAVRMTDKMPANIWNVGMITAMFPHARFIYVRRDPRDACISCFFRNFLNEHHYTTQLDWVGHQWRHVDLLGALWGRVFDDLGEPEKWMVVQYEEFVGDADAWVPRLIEHADLEWDDSCLSIEADTRDVPTLRSDQVGRKIDSSSVGKWKKYTEHLGPLFEALGDEWAPDGAEA